MSTEDRSWTQISGRDNLNCDFLTNDYVQPLHLLLESKDPRFGRTTAMDLESLREEMGRHLGSLVSMDEKLTENCCELCRAFNVTPENLRFKWEAIEFRNSTKSNFSSFTMDSVDALRKELQREKDSYNRKARTGQGTLLNSGLFPKARLQHTLVERKLAVKKENEQRAGAVAFAGPLGHSLANDSAGRYMFERAMERSEALDDMIDEMSEMVRKHYAIEELGDPGAPTDENVFVVGRVVVSSEHENSNEVKLSENSVSLESSRSSGSGRRVPIRFESNLKIRGEAKTMGLFPGAIVAFYGRNGGGGWFLVSEILSLPPLDLGSSITPEHLSPFSVLIACGPFTSDHDLLYKPWHKFLDSAIAQKPEALVLIGPFLDSAHPSSLSGEFDRTPRQYFDEFLTARIFEFLDGCPGSLVILVPGTRDLISDFAVFPQKGLDLKTLNDPRIHLMPNPGQFSINGIEFGVTSVDVLFHLRKEEYTVHELTPSGTEQVQDPLAKLCRHILQQRSFYPIFPVPADLTSELNLDMTNNTGLRIGHATAACPDVFILPSRFKHFQKNVESRTFINTSFLSKGFYAKISFSEGEGSILNRSTVDLQKV